MPLRALYACHRVSRGMQTPISSICRLPGRSESTAVAPHHSSASFRRGPVLWLILCGVLLVAAITISTALIIGQFRERALSNSERELENAVLLLTRHFDQQFEDADILATDLIAKMQFAGSASPEIFSSEMSTYDAHLMLKSKASVLSYIGDVNIYNSDGQLINSSGGWPLADVNVAGREYFGGLKSNRELKLTLGEPVQSYFTGKPTTVIAHRLSGLDGVFLGVMARRIDSANFQNFFASVVLGDGAAISMFHRDGTLLARYPHADAMIGHKLKTAPLLEKVWSEGGLQTLRFESAVDQQDRLGSAAPLGRFPIIVVATSTVAVVLSDWRAQTRFMVAAAVLSALVIAFILFLIVRQVNRQNQQSQQQLASEKHRLDTALNNMTQGLVLYDKSARMVICNQRYIDMCGLSASVVKPGCHFLDVVRHRKETGSFEGNVEEFCSNILQNIAHGKISHNIMEAADGRSFDVVNTPLSQGRRVATIDDVTDRRRADEKIAHLAHYDALTDRPKRVLIRERIEQELQRACRGQQFALLYIDVDEFKGINDSLGHHVGDELLKAVAGRIRDCIRDTDHIARLGGDELAVIQTDVENSGDVVEFVTRIHEAIRQPYECLGHQLMTDASIGIALAPQDGTDLDQLIKNADLAMYGAKANGRRTYRFFEPAMDAHAKARLSLERDLRQALF